MSRLFKTAKRRLYRLMVRDQFANVYDLADSLGQPVNRTLIRAVKAWPGHSHVGL